MLCIGRYDNFQSAITSETTKVVQDSYSTIQVKYATDTSYLLLTGW